MFFISQTMFYVKCTRSWHVSQILFQRSLFVVVQLIVARNSNVHKRPDARQRYRDVRRETFKIIKSTLVTTRAGFLSACGNYGCGNIAVVYKAFDCLRGALIPRDIKLHLSSSVPPVKSPRLQECSRDSRPAVLRVRNYFIPVGVRSCALKKHLRAEINGLPIPFTAVHVLNVKSERERDREKDSCIQ